MPDQVSAASQRPDPTEKLVRVFDTEQESEALIVRGLLESAGIDADLTSLDATQETFPGVGGVIILVRESDAERARSLIEEYRQAPETSDEAGDATAEMEAIEDPSSQS